MWILYDIPWLYSFPLKRLHDITSAQTAKFISLLRPSFYSINPTPLHFQLFYYFLVWFLTSFLSHAGPALSTFLTFFFLPKSRSNSLLCYFHTFSLRSLQFQESSSSSPPLPPPSPFFVQRKGICGKTQRAILEVLNTERSHVQIPGRVVIWKECKFIDWTDGLHDEYKYMRKRKLDDDLWQPCHTTQIFITVWILL